MAEWSKAADCKSVRYSRVGSNPTFLIIKNCIIYKENLSLNVTVLKKRTALKIAMTKKFDKHLTNSKGNYLALVLNFKRVKFFPYIYSRSDNVFFTGSLGIISNRVGKGKCLKTKKMCYLGLAKLLRRVILHSNFASYNLVVRRTPKYLYELLNTLYSQSINVYTSPISKSYYNESSYRDNNVIRPALLYYRKVANYYFRKLGSKGRLKRKITKRLISSNRVMD